jgi:hypothetical protein
MSLPPRDDEQPTPDDPAPTQQIQAHPEPLPDPVPDPGPPQPIPPPEPIPVPEPPHAIEPAQAVEPSFVPEPATSSLSDAPPDPANPSDVTYPPLGAYPGEPGHPQPVEATGDLPTQAVWQTPIPASQQFQPSHEWHPGQTQQQWHPGAPGPTPPHPHAHQQPPPWPAPQNPPYLTPPVPAAGKRHTALWVSLALAFTLLLCGGGATSAFLLLRDAESSDGAPDPETAVTRFLTAVYSEQDASAANALVCREARDTKKLTAKVDEIKGYSRAYDGPQFRWEEPSVADQNEERAMVSVDLTMTTDDEKSAQQRLTFTVVKKTGWWVCEIAG